MGKWLVRLLVTAAAIAVGLISMEMGYSQAATSADILITATPSVGGGGGSVTGFTITYVNSQRIDFSWSFSGGTDRIMIRAKYGSYPDNPPNPNTAPSDGYLVYYGPAVSASDTSMYFEDNPGPIYYRAWAQKVDDTWTISPDGEGREESRALTLLALVLLAMGLTIAMFMSRQMMLGFPSVIMWAVLGAYAYTESTIPWGDWQYYLAFVSLFGMTIFCALAMYGLRERKDTEAEGDEETEGTGWDKGFKDQRSSGNKSGGRDESESKPSRRTIALHKRAAARRGGGVQKKTDWGEFK